MQRGGARSAPNILVTGTPGVGKSTLAKALAEATGLAWLDVSRIARDHGCLLEYDEEYQCPVLDEDKLLDGLEARLSAGGNIVDYHSSEFFPERWFDVVFVLRTDNKTLYDRLQASLSQHYHCFNRDYCKKKLDDNLQCEIFGVCHEEAANSYDRNIVHELAGTSQQDLQENLQRISLWVQNWLNDNRPQ